MQFPCWEIFVSATPTGTWAMKTRAELLGFCPELLMRSPIGSLILVTRDPPSHRSTRVPLRAGHTRNIPGPPEPHLNTVQDLNNEVK